MPPAIDSTIKRKVIQQWLAGDSRSKIAIDNNIGEGTVSGIVRDFKVGLESSEFDSARELALEAKNQGLTISDLASHFRLYNFIKKSGAAEDKIESFIANVSSSDAYPEKVIQYVNQLYDLLKKESIPLDQVSSYIKQKLQDKQRIDEQIKEADAILQSKNVNIEAINEHIQLNQKLNEYGLSMHNIDELLNLVLNAKRYGFEPNKIVGKLRTIRRLEKKEKKLENNCTILSNLLDKHRETVPLAELIEAMHIGKSELISFKIAVNEAAELYGFSASTAAFHVLNNIRDYNKIGGLKKELNKLTTQVFSVNEICFRQNKSMMAMLNLQSRGITEDRIFYINNILEQNGYNNINMKSNS